MPSDKPRGRILIVGQHFWPENFRINDIADFFIEQQYGVDVLCGLPNYPKGEFMPGYGYFGRRHETHRGIRVDRVLEIKRGNNSSLRIFLNYISYPFFSLFHIPKLLFRHYDHIFIYQLSPVMMAISGIILGKLTRVPTTMYVLDLWPENLFSVLPIHNSFLRKLATRHSHWYYRNVDHLIALSQTMRDKLATISGKNPDDIPVIPQACEKIYETKKSDPNLRKRFGDTFNVVFTGNISPAQSFPTMLEAAKILSDAGHDNIRWIIVGDGMSRKQVEAEVQKLGLTNFVFEGQQPIEMMPAYADIADVLVGCLVTSELLEATIPAKVMSYIALGKPIVLAMDGEVNELINSAIECGFVGPTENSDALAENILCIYKLSLERREEMGANAREYHDKHFRRDVLLKELIKTVANRY